MPDQFVKEDAENTEQNETGNAIAREKADDDKEDTAGGRKGTFSLEDLPKADDVETQWSPGSNQSEL